MKRPYVVLAVVVGIVVLLIAAHSIPGRYGPAGPWGYGMMSSYRTGPGMTGGYAMGPRAMGGYGVNPGMMSGYGMGPGMMGNPRVMLGTVSERDDDDTISVDIVTTEGSVLVQRFNVNRHTGATSSDQG